MRVALVLTGLSRCWEQAYPTFNEYFLKPYNPDVFINIWSEKGYYSGKSYLQAPQDEFVRLTPDDKGFHTSGELADVNAMMKAYNPITMRVEDFSKYEAMIEQRVSGFTKAYTRPKNTAAQAFMAMRGMELIREYQEQHFSMLSYDLVIRTRPDVILRDNPMPLTPDALYTVPLRNKNGQGTGDVIQISNQDHAFQFSIGLWANLKTLYERCGVSCPHLFVVETAKMFNIPWREMPIGAWVAHSPKGPYQEPD